MSIIAQLQNKLSERHKTLQKHQKVLAAIDRAGVSPNTYYRALDPKETVHTPTLERIVVAQKEIIDEYEASLQNI